MNKQKGQIAILIPIAMLIAGLFLFTYTKNTTTTPVQAACMVGDSPEDKQLSLPVNTGLDKALDQSGGPGATYATYKLVRANVAINPLWQGLAIFTYNNYMPGPPASGQKHMEKSTQTSDGKYDIYYPMQYGESTLPFSFRTSVSGEREWSNSPTNTMTTEFRFMQEGIIFFLHLDSQGKPVTTNGIDRITKQPATFWVFDIYQDINRYNQSLTGARGYTQDQIFGCSGNNVSTTPVAEYPVVTGGDGKQIQLRNFVIKSDVSNSYGFSAHCKPAIYLYPEKETSVNVKVNTKGELLYTKPLYPFGGWNVLAYPDGRIIYNGQNYDYLYYESRIPDSLIDKPKEGFVVSYQELPQLYSSMLPKLGLSQNQTTEFKNYWEKVLPKSPYYFVGVMDQNNINSFEPLEINPKPATMIRVRLYFEALDKKINAQQPVIQTPERNGFTLVEWGGMVKIDKNHPFTCSQ